MWTISATANTSPPAMRATAITAKAAAYWAQSAINSDNHLKNHFFKEAPNSAGEWVSPEILYTAKNAAMHYSESSFNKYNTKPKK